MKTITLTFLLAFVSFLPGIFGQEDQSEDKIGDQYNGFRFMALTTDLGDLNQTLLNNGFSGLEDYGYGFELTFKGIPLDYRFNGVGSIGYLRRDGIQQGPNRASISQFTSSLGLEYRTLKTRKAYINPGFLLHFEYNRLNISKGIIGDGLDDLLISDISNTHAGSFQVPISVYLTAGTFFKIGSTEIDLGVTAGYKWYYINNDWFVNENFAISDGIDLSSPFLSLNIGFKSTD